MKKSRPKYLGQLFYSRNKDFDFKKLEKRNPEFAEKLKRQFDLGRSIVSCQLFNGINFENENLMRYYLHEYSSRFLQYGPGSFPTSFNLMEAFFNFNLENVLFELLEEESYGVSLYDFLDFITSNNFVSKNVNLFDEIDENLIYHITFTSGIDDISFKTDDGKEFFIGHVSLVRREQEIVVVLSAGEVYDKEGAEESIKSNSKEVMKGMITSYKKSLGLTIDDSLETKIVNYLDREDLWLTIAIARFDIENKTLDTRYIAQDYNTSFMVTTDDPSIMIDDFGKFITEDARDRYNQHLSDLEKSSSLFEFAKFCMYIPYYINKNEEKIIQVEYPTKLNELINGPISRRKYKEVNAKYKLFSKPIYFLESDNMIVQTGKKIREDQFKVETSGFWKKLKFNEQGVDKKGQAVMGRTWVERSEVYYQTNVGPVEIVNNQRFDGPMSGYIYIS